MRQLAEVLQRKEDLLLSFMKIDPRYCVEVMSQSYAEITASLDTIDWILDRTPGSWRAEYRTLCNERDGS